MRIYLPFSILVCLVLCAAYVDAQFPEILWQRSFGSAEDDDFRTLAATADGGFILGIYSDADSSADKSEDAIGPGYWIEDDEYGDFHVNYKDYWIMKIDSDKNIEWENTIGGDDDDYLTVVRPVNDGGYIVGGYSSSGIYADKTDGVYGWPPIFYDYWILKLDGSGNILWQRTLGGAKDDYLYDIMQTADGGFIACGKSNSDAGFDKSEDAINDHFDYWIIKLDSAGNTQWENTIGGGQDDIAKVIVQTPDSGFTIGGYTYSGAGFDKTVGIHGSYDLWIVHLDPTGHIVWQKGFGSTGNDALYAMQLLPDGGYILGCTSDSNAGFDKSESGIGGDDYWILRLDNLGNILWENTIGGDENDYMEAVLDAGDGGFLIGGSSLSDISGDKTENRYYYTNADYWIVKLSSDGDIIWQKDYGGFYGDYLYDMVRMPGGTYTIAGMSNSFESGNKSVSTKGGYDAWLIGLGEDCMFNIEACNGFDDNCNGETDEGLPTYMLYYDGDVDGFGNIGEDSISCFAELPGFVTDNTDCNDTSALVFPGVTEICNMLDDNCNGNTDEGFPQSIFYIDADGDTYGTEDSVIVSCYASIEGFVLVSSDCNDSDPDIHPLAPEEWNGVDDNCNNLIDEGIMAVQDIPVEVLVFPNPCVDILHLQNTSNANCSITISDVLGRIIYTGLLKEEILNIPTATWSPGIYYIELKKNAIPMIQKVIKR